MFSLALQLAGTEEFAMYQRSFFFVQAAVTIGTVLVAVLILMYKGGRWHEGTKRDIKALDNRVMLIETNHLTAIEGKLDANAAKMGEFGERVVALETGLKNVKEDVDSLYDRGTA